MLPYRDPGASVVFRRVKPDLPSLFGKVKAMYVNSRLSSTKIAPGALLSLTPESAPQKTGPHVPRILIADDNIVILKALSIKLKSKGYEVRTAMDGSTAVSCVRREKPDLIILDISFPPDVAHGGGISWDGFTILDWLRRLDEARETPVIFITSGEGAKFRERAMSMGAVAFFEKPIDDDELVHIVQDTVGEPPSKGGHDPAL